MGGQHHKIDKLQLGQMLLDSKRQKERVGNPLQPKFLGDMLPDDDEFSVKQLYTFLIFFVKNVKMVALIV